MQKDTDIAIIGGGLASLATAVELQRSGLEITLVRKAPGATALSSGAWDLAHSPMTTPTNPWEEFPLLSDVLEEILRNHPHHAYSFLAPGFSGKDIFSVLREKTLQVAESLPLPMSGNLKKNQLMVTDFGSLKPTALVQRTMESGDVSTFKKAKVLVVGIEGFPRFNAYFIRQALTEAQQKQDKGFIDLAGHLEVKVPGVLSEASLSPVEIALALDRMENVVELGNQIEEYIQNKVYTHLLLPPVMGFSNASSVVENLAKRTHLKSFETLATPMSVPGWRLSEAILNYFKKQEYDILEGEAIGFDESHRSLKSIRIHNEDKRVKLRAKHFVLASGKYISGGILRKDSFKEPIFGLPLFSEGQLLNEAGVFQRSRTPSSDPQPFLSAGVSIDVRGRPVDQYEQVCFENLYAAGEILAGLDPARDGCNEGVSVLSGVLAAQSIMD